MTHQENLNRLLECLLRENKDYERISIPSSQREQKILLRSLMNLRPPKPAAPELLSLEDSYLSEELAQKHITYPHELKPLKEHIYLWRGDITTLAADAIVNAANHALLGCFIPCHGCIDNAIHSAAGIQLRLACKDLMDRQGHEEKNGGAKITPAFHLPCRYVLHTVGPIIYGRVAQKDRRELADCYRSCLKLAAEYECQSIAFCCISTGEFHFPNEEAAEIAVETVKEFLNESAVTINVIFNVFKESDEQIYRRLLSENHL